MSKAKKKTGHIDTEDAEEEKEIEDGGWQTESTRAGLGKRRR